MPACMQHSTIASPTTPGVAHACCSYIGGTDISGAGWANMPCLLDYGGNAALSECTGCQQLQQAPIRSTHTQTLALMGLCCTPLLAAASPPTETSTSGICHTNPWEEWSALLAWKQTWNQAPWLTGWDTGAYGVEAEASLACSLLLLPHPHSGACGTA